MKLRDKINQQRSEIRHHGFTLVEMMIVIIVLAVISLYVITLSRDTAEKQSINRTLVDIKNWQEAAMFFYSQNKKWPDSMQDLTDNGYFPEEARCSPWHGNQNTISICPKKAIYEGQKSSNLLYFTLSIEVPTDRIAKQLGAKLPQVEVVGNVLKSAVAIPGYYIGGVTSAGILENGKLLYVPLCPLGYEGHYIEAPQYFTTGYYLHLLGGDPGVNIELGIDDYVRGATGNNPYIYSFIHVHSPTKDPTVTRTYYMTFCLPSGQWKPLSGASQFEKQCSSDWQNYNSPFGSPC